MLGRTTGAADATAGAPPVFVMAHKMWVKHFNADPNVVGRVLTLNGVPTTRRRRDAAAVHETGRRSVAAGRR